jgi:HSP20 family protein
MLVRRETPFNLLREMTSELDRMFDDAPWPSIKWPALRGHRGARTAAWLPEIDIFEKDNRLVTKVDLPGMKKEDVKVEIADGQLTISGERRSEAEEKKENFYRSERSYGSFYRAVPVPDGVKLEDIKAQFADGVLEVSMPIPVQRERKAGRVEIEDADKPALAAV